MGQDRGQGIFNLELIREALRSLTPLVLGPTASTLAFRKGQPNRLEGKNTHTQENKHDYL